MASLRERLNAYGAAPARPTPPAKTDCYRAFDRTPRESYPLPDTLSGNLLTALTGEETGDVPLEKLLFLDTETTGLSGGAGTLAFLTGLGYFENGSFVVEQELMRDYDEEVFLLSHVAQRLGRASMLVTFNGRTFDMPLLQSRFIMQRMRESFVLPAQTDLLRVARSTWKLRLKRCTLAALEEAILGVKRPDDLPGALVPKQFFDFLRCGDFALLSPVLKHNCQDIKSLPVMLARLLALYEDPFKCEHAPDVFSVGRVMEKRGNLCLARRCYRAADKGTLSRLSRLTLADSYRREKRFGDAATVYETMVSCGQGGPFPLIALAKLYEHRLSSPERALYCTKKAMLLTNPYDDKALEDAQKRAIRLMKKCRKGQMNHGNPERF